jgi:hypothetical protein
LGFQETARAAILAGFAALVAAVQFPVGSLACTRNTTELSAIAALLIVFATYALRMMNR